MPETKKPRAGSLQFYPRKRAKRIYPRVSTYPSIDARTEKPKLLLFAGYKAGMLHIVAKDTTKGSASFGEDITVPVTVLDCPPMVAVGVRAYVVAPKGLSIISEAWADKLPKGFELKTKGKKETKTGASSSTQFAKMEKEAGRIPSVRLIVATQPRLAGFGKKTKDVFEIEIAGKSAADKLSFAKEALGKEIKTSDVFREGEFVDAIAITKGKGTAGPVKRFGVVIQSRHAKGKRRHVGSLGQEQPGRVRWTVPMAGQLGFQQRTEFNKRLLKVNDSGEAGKEVTPASGFKGYGIVKGPYVLVEGSLPGHKKRLVFLRTAMRLGRKKFVMPEIKEIVK